MEDFTFPFYFLCIINVVLSAFSKILCTLIYHKVPEHTEYCIFVLYCTGTGMWCTVGLLSLVLLVPDKTGSS